MGRRRKVRQEETVETLKSRNPDKEVDDESLSANTVEEGDGEASTGKFFACYLLTSLSSRFKGHTYIGFTVNPRRRIRQHNGEITSGAWRTKKRRPWEMVLCIYGFPTNVAALQFEWAWQHPVESVAVRQAAATFKSLSGLANKIKLVYTMLNLPSWQSLNLTVNFFSTKYIKHAVSCPRLPQQMRVQVCTMDELPCYTGNSFCVDENDDLHSADDDCEQSSGSQESTENDLVEPQTLDDNTVDRHAAELDQYDLAELGAVSRRHSEKLCKGSFRHDQNSEKQLLCSFSSHNKMITNAEDEEIIILSDELLRQPKNSGVGEEQVHKQSLQPNACPVKPPSFSVSSCSKIAAIAEEQERIFHLLDEECIDEHVQLEHQQTRENTIFPDKIQCASNICSEIEVIEVFTPPPSCKANARTKKRRLSATEIIDLTISPLLV